MSVAANWRYLMSVIRVPPPLSKLAGVAMMVTGGAWLVLLLFHVVTIGGAAWARGVGAGIGLGWAAIGVQVFRAPRGEIATL